MKWARVFDLLPDSLHIKVRKKDIAYARKHRTNPLLHAIECHMFAHGWNVTAKFEGKVVWIYDSSNEFPLVGYNMSEHSDLLKYTQLPEPTVWSTGRGYLLRY